MRHYLELSEEQLECVSAIEDFLKDKSRQVFNVFGLAGTGKTTLLAYLTSIHDMNLCTFTGKAASVLQRKSGVQVNTIHSLFYRLVKEEIINGRREMFFKFHYPNMSNEIIAVDESSMVNTDIGNDLLKTLAKIISFGDPGQLPPVNGERFFQKPDFTLKQIHRQALQSPIIRQAHRMRQTGLYIMDTDEFRVVKKLNDVDLLEADAVLVWKNQTRHDLNKHIRKLKGFSGNPKAGEQILCLKNSHDHGLCNGEVYTLAADCTHGMNKMIELTNGTNVPAAFFTTADLILPKKCKTAFDFGYCLTVHKSQGSEWENVAVVDEYSRFEDRRKWCYTAFTRASKRIVIEKV